MEEFVTNRKKKPTKIEDMTKEQIRQAILKKRECNAKAQNIVESLLENQITQDYFMRCLPQINQSHFEDIIEERSIIKQCGYPLCTRAISEKDIPRQKYRISMKTNKVYDISARKNFCSNSCYKSAMHIKKQMLTSPLWFREYEIIPNFSLLPLDSEGSMGQEIDVALIEKLSVKDVAQSFTTSVNDFATVTLRQMSKREEGEQTEGLNIENCDKGPSIQENNIDKSSIIEKNIPCIINESAESKKDNACNKKVSVNPLNIVGDVVERPERKVDPILIEKPNPKCSTKDTEVPKRSTQKKQPLIVAVTIEVEKCLGEWFTLDTLIFLFGEEKVKEMVVDKGDSIKEYLSNCGKSIFYSSNSYDQYQALCRKLNMLELEDRRQEAQTLQRETKPLPDYTMLQEESKNMQLKVKAFLAGTTEIAEIPFDPEAESAADEDTLKLTQLPLVDKNAQNALRRKIVCQHLNKVLPDILKSLGLLTLSITLDVRLLVNTFKLKATNIMFKPIQWTLIAIVIIKLLTIRDRRLQYLLDQQPAYQHLQLLLLSYKQDGGYLDRLISWLIDIDRLLDVSDTQLTVE